jgi:hypothetical protein
MSNIFKFNINRSLGEIVRVTVTPHDSNVWITPFRRNNNGSLRRAGGKRCTTEQFHQGIRVILSYIDAQSSTKCKPGKQEGGGAMSQQHIELTQIEPNVFIYSPPSPPQSVIQSPPSPSSLSPPSPAPSPAPLTEKELLDAEHASWYDNVIPRFSRNDSHRFFQMNRLRERWIRRGRRIGELPPSRLYHVAMKGLKMFRR